MSMFTLTFAAGVLFPVAHAADPPPPREVHLVTGSFASGDRHFGLYSPNDHIGASGARLGLRVAGRWSLVGDYTRRTVVSEYSEPMVDNASDTAEHPTLTASFTGQQVTLGPKFQANPLPWLGTYGTARGLLFFGTTHLDDDPTTDDNPNQLTARARAPGFVAAAGIQVNPVLEQRSVRPSGFFEAGYGWTRPLAFVDDTIQEHSSSAPASMGSLTFRGAYIQAGVGLRF